MDDDTRHFVKWQVASIQERMGDLTQLLAGGDPLKWLDHDESIMSLLARLLVAQNKTNEILREMRDKL